MFSYERGTPVLEHKAGKNTGGEHQKFGVPVPGPTKKAKKKK